MLTEKSLSSAAVGRPFLQIEGLAKSYPGTTEPVFDQVNFSIARGEFVCIIGHSGCGKTTILNVLAGLESASAGNVFMDGREVAGPSLERGVVFQGHALMPWLTVRKNIGFAVLMSNGPQARVAEIVRNTMPRDRQRATVHHDPQYYPLRNHLVDFLVARSKHLSHGKAPAHPPTVEPGRDALQDALPFVTLKAVA